MRALVLAVSLTAACAAPAFSQEKAPEPAGFSETLDVQGVNLEVVVTGRDGRRVPGLTGRDFVLRVDGKPVPIDFFLEVRDGRAAQAAALPGAAEPAQATVAAGEPVPTNYLVLVDDYFSPLFLRNEALKALSQQLRSLGPRDRIALVAMDGSFVRILSPWRPVSQGISDLFDQAGRQQRFLTLADLGSNAGPLAIGGQQRIHEEVRSDPMSDVGFDDAMRRVDAIRRVMEQSAVALRAFSDQPGRKVALLLSAGWPVDMRGLTGVNSALIRDGYSLLDPLIDTANLLGYTLYPIHMAEKSRLLPAGEDPGTVTGQAGFSRSNSLAINQNSLSLPAQKTGGELLGMGSAYLDRIGEDTRSYYWLGFTHAGGEPRRLPVEVEVLREGLTARSRASFVPLPREARVAMRIESALLTGTTEGMEPLAVSAGDPVKAGRSLVDVPLSIRFPMRQITLVRDSGFQGARIELRTTSLDAKGQRSEVTRVPLEIRLTDEQMASGKDLVHEMTVRLRRVPQDLVVALYDPASGRLLASRLAIDPGKGR